MATKDNLKSGRKKFMVMKVKSSIMGILKTDAENVDTELDKILQPLIKTFGESLAIEILDDAIVGADQDFSDAMKQAVVQTTKEEMQKSQ